MIDVPATSWLDPRIEVRLSAIDRLGLFAAAPIRAGEVVIRWGGRVIDDAEVARLHAVFVATGAEYSCAAIGEGLNLEQAPGDPLRFGNHGCDPNTWMTDAVTQAARRDIAAGAELTVDYATTTVSATWRMDCRCGSAICRGEARGDDWMRPDLQVRYAGHFSPFIAARIERARAALGRRH